MKKYMILFVLFVANQLMSQDIPIDLPNLNPQSPNAYQFAKYGEVNVNESTGIISPSIPLYTYKSGNISIPIVLNYSGNGVKVAQETSWTGINWNLSVGGVITRQVRDLPDEKPNTIKKYYTMNQLDDMDGYLQYTDTSKEWYNELELIGNGDLIDSEVDIFNYNFLGYSGSFYLDENFDAHLIKYDKELDINFQYDTNGLNQSIIYIKTSEGDTYAFGGAGASESSKTYVSTGPESNALVNYSQNAFYLDYISPYNGGQINFTYNQVIGSSGERLIMGSHENLTKFASSDGACTPGSITYNYSKNDLFADFQYKIYLKKIESTFNDTYIEFTTENLGKTKHKLNYVYIKEDANDNLVKKFELTYDTYTTETYDYDDRFFLKQVDFIDKNSNIVYDYKLEYNSPNLLPSKESYARDENGYFNGVTSNTALLPIHPNFTNTITLANRDVDSLKIKYGSLSKITYPTGGYSTFGYESPIKGFSIGSDLNSMVVYHNDPTRNGESDYEDQLWFEDDGLYHLEAGQTVDVNLIMTTVADIMHQSSVTVSTVLNGNTQVVYTKGIGNSENTTKNYNENFTINIMQTGDYYFKLNLNLQPTELNDQDIEIDIIAGINIPNQIPIPEYYPSIRIKSIYTYDSPTAPPLIKVYYYNEREDIDQELNYLVNDASFYYVSKVKRGCGGLLFSYDTYHNLTTSALNNVYGDDSGKILYPYVTVSYGGSNFELGGKQSKFKVSKEGGLRPYFGEEILYSTYGQNLSFANSTLSKEIYFTYDSASDQFSTQKEVLYDYTILNGTQTMNNIKAYKIATGNGFADIRDYNFGLYDIDSRKYALTKVTSTEVLDNLETITSIENFTYNSYMGQPSVVKKTDSRGIDSEKQFYYPKDVQVNSENLTLSEKDLIEDLDSQHRISQPYMIKEYYDNELIGSSQTIYSDEWYTNMIWPKKVNTKKGPINNYQERLEFKEYNFYGRLEEVSQTEGATTQYRYNLNQQVILKMDNYDSTYVIDDSIPLNTPCYNQVIYPYSLVTTYEYDPDTNQLLSITSPNCDTTYYDYDNFGRLKTIKDEDGKILSQSDYHFKD